MRIAHLSDLHFGAHDPKLIEPLCGAIKDAKPDLVAITGDITQFGKKREFAQARRFVDRLPAPALVAPGNHDTPYFNLVSRLFHPFSRFERCFDSRNLGHHVSPALCAVAVNTARGAQFRLDWSLGVADPDDVDGAADTLRTCSDTALRVVLCHHPLMEAPGSPMRTKTLGGTRAAQLFHDAGVDAVLSGHIHTRFAAPYPIGDGKTYAVGAATALSTRTRGEAPSFNLLTVSGHTLGFRVMAWSGSGFSEAGAEERRLRTAIRAA